MNQFSALADSNEYIDPTNIKFFEFTGLVPDAKVIIQEEPFGNNYPATVSLFAVSNKNGYYASATTKGLTFGTTKSLRQTFYSADNGEAVPINKDTITISLKKAVQQVRFSGDESLLLISLKGGSLSVYNVDDILTKKNEALPMESYDWDLNIKDLRPNPEALPNLAALLFEDNHCKIIDISTGNTQCDIPIDNVSAICWSPKGKQIVCGTMEGQLLHFDTNGVAKSELAIPAAMSAGHGEEETNRYVQDVLWIENHIFLVLYSRKRSNSEDEYLNDGYIINRKPASGSAEPEYIRLAEITPIFTTEGRGNHFYMEVIRDFGKEIKHLVIITNAATTEVSVVGQNEQGEWATWSLPENGLASLPLSAETFMDTYPLGMAVDFTADEKLPSLDAGDADSAVDPMPVLYFINDEGHISAYHCYNIDLARRGEAFIPPTLTASTAAPAAPAAAIPNITQTPNFAGLNSTSTSSFGDLLSGKNNTPAPASSGFGFGGFGGAPPAAGGFASFSSLGSAQKIPATPTAGFAASKTLDATVPTFGSTTNFGFGANKSAPASDLDKPLSSFGANKEQVVPEKKAAETSFGSTGFGSTSAAPTSAFGSTPSKPAVSAFGSTTSSFGSLAKTTTTPAFGSTSSVGGFGSFGKTTTTPAFGSTATLGSGGFGSLAKNTVPGATAPTTTPAFGSTATIGSGGFGSLAKSTVPGAIAPTTTPSFGSTATLGSGGFGSLAKSTVPGAIAPTTTPTFGSTATLGSGGFGSLAKNTVPGATAPSSTPSFGSTATLGSGGYGSLAKSTVPGATAPSSTPSFGSTATLGSGGFGSLAKNTVPGATAPTTTPTFGSTATIGSGGFGSLAKSTIPGATAPTTTPSFGSTATLGSGGFGSLVNKPASNVSFASKPLFGPPSSLSSNISTTENETALAKTSEVKAVSSATATVKSSTEAPAESKLLSSEAAESKITPSESKMPATAPKPTAVESDTPAKPEGKSKEKLKPTAEEGMAREYESLYITVCEDITELSLAHEKINKIMNVTTLSVGSKTEASLKDKNSVWDLNDVADYATLTQRIIESIAKDQTSIIQTKNSLQALSAATKKSMDKKEDIKFVLGREFDDRIIDVLDQRELDAETKDELSVIENKSEAYESILSNLEFRVQEYKKRNKIKNDHNAGELTLYSLHRAIRDIQREIVSRNNDLAELEGRLAVIKLNESIKHARQSSGGFSCEDISDDEEEHEINPEVIKNTTRYIRRFNFLRDVCSQAHTRAPLQCPVE